MLAAAVAGCGGQPTDQSDDQRGAAGAGCERRIEVGAGGHDDPGCSRRRQQRPKQPPRSGLRWGRGLGNAQGAGRLRREPAAAEGSARKGKAAKNPEVCAVDGPIVSERLIIDAATKGVKNVLVYLPRPTGGERRCQEGDGRQDR